MSSGQPRVLCVDDEPKVLDGLESVLAWNYEVFIACSGAEGLEILRQNGPFAVVISDMRMPAMDGATFLKEVHDEAPDTTRILLTGYSAMDAAVAAVNKGKIFRFLTKPCRPDELLPAVDAAVEQNRLVRSVEEGARELARRNAELESLNKQLAQASITDPLTGLHNRRFVRQFIGTRMAAARRNSVKRQDEATHGRAAKAMPIMFFMMIDLDGFKQINDRWGHLAGDRVLLAVKDRLLECCRSADSVIRWGGDEFMIIGEVEEFAGISVFAERIRERVSGGAYYLGRNDVGRLSASIGAVPCPFRPLGPVSESWEQAVAVADQAVYLAKRNGRNAWVVLRGAESLIDGDQSRLCIELRALVEAGKIEVTTSIGEGIDLHIWDERAAIQEFPADKSAFL